MFISHFCILLCRKSKLFVVFPVACRRAENALNFGRRSWYTQDSTSDRVKLWQHCTILFPFVHGNGIPMGMGIIPIPIYIIPIPMTYEIFCTIPMGFPSGIPWEWYYGIPMHISIAHPKKGEPIFVRFCTTTRLRDIMTYSGRFLNISNRFVFTRDQIFHHA